MDNKNVRSQATLGAEVASPPLSQDGAGTTPVLSKDGAGVQPQKIEDTPLRTKPVDTPIVYEKETVSVADPVQTDSTTPPIQEASSFFDFSGIKSVIAEWTGKKQPVVEEPVEKKSILGDFEPALPGLMQKSQDTKTQKQQEAKALVKELIAADPSSVVKPATKATGSPYKHSLGSGGKAFVSTKTRESVRPGNGKINVSLDFNASESGTAKGTEVIIPDDAPPQVREAAEAFNNMVVEFADKNGIKGYKNRGVKTRSQNGRGVKGTVHTEPFFNKDMAIQKAIEANPGEFARIYEETFGNIPEAQIIAPHGVKKDRGAVSGIFKDETSYGELITSEMLKARRPQA